LESIRGHFLKTISTERADLPLRTNSFMSVSIIRESEVEGAYCIMQTKQSPIMGSGEMDCLMASVNPQSKMAKSYREGL
jgi:hypothetical protein